MANINLGTPPQGLDGETVRAAFEILNRLIATIEESNGGVIHAGDLQQIAINPTAADDPNNRRAFDMEISHDCSNLESGFTDATGINMVFTSRNGQNSYGTTNAKTTFAPQLITHNGHSGGQSFCIAVGMLKYGMGDTFCIGQQLSFASGPIAGDEGIGFSPVNHIVQQRFLTQTTLVRDPTRSSLNTTITHGIVGKLAPQDVAVTSTAGAQVGDWIILGQAVATNTPNIEAVQILAIGSGTINGVFKNNQPSGTTITPALVLTVADTEFFGNDRVLVNLSGVNYGDGLISSITNGAVLTGSGTAWSNDMVGGNATNIGVLIMQSDVYSGPPFSEDNPLYSFFQIKEVTDATHLNIYSNTIAGSQAYNGPGPGSGGYAIFPAARVLKILDYGVVVCETSTAVWGNGDFVELAICPYPDVTLYSSNVEVYTPGATCRNGYGITNNGAVGFGAAYACDAVMANGAPYGWYAGFNPNACQYGMLIGRNIGIAAIGLECAVGGGSDTQGLLDWHGGTFSFGPSGSGFVWKCTTLESIVVSYRPGGDLSDFQWNGNLTLSGFGGGGGTGYPRLRLCRDQFFVDGSIDLNYSPTSPLFGSGSMNVVGNFFSLDGGASNIIASFAHQAFGLGPRFDAYQDGMVVPSIPFSQFASLRDTGSFIRRSTSIQAVPVGVGTAAVMHYQFTVNGSVRFDVSEQCAYLPTTNGAPAFVPDAVSGLAPVLADPAHNKLWMYNGSGWVSTTLS